MKRIVSAAAVLAAAAGIASAGIQYQYCIDFEEDAQGNPIAEGQIIDNEYAGWGAIFVANVLDVDDDDTWASNTDMAVTSDPDNVGGGYNPAMGNILHTFNGWLGENGDPNFAIFFDAPISDLEIGFTGDFDGLSEIGVFDGEGDFIGADIADGDGTLKVASLHALSTAEIGVVLPGWFFDWVGVVYVKWNYVPAPSATALLGLGGLALARRRR